MVDQLNGFAGEVSRVAREVGTEGKLGGQAQVPGVAGTWKDLTDNVNSMASNLTGQVRNIADVATAVANGDLVQEDHRRREGRDSGAEEHAQHDGRSAQRLRRRSHPRGARGRHRRQARRPGRRCTAWPAPGRISPTTSTPWPPTSPARSATSPTWPRPSPKGDLSSKITVEVKGEILELKNTDQHDGRSAQRLRLGSDPRGPRGRHRRQARRPGGGARRGRHLEGPHRQRQLHGLQPHRPGPQHRRSDHGRGQRRSCPRRSRSTCAARFWS